MTIIRCRREGESHVLTLTGHAGYAPAGGDIVCAGISALAFALWGWLGQRGALEEAAEGSGSLTLRFRADRESDVALSMALLGWQIIAETYPHHAEVDRAPGDRADKREQTAGKEHTRCTNT